MHNRYDGSVDFARNWTSYENFFGDFNGEFWLGKITLVNFKNNIKFESKNLN